jgi:S-formylglutathione hydrolase
LRVISEHRCFDGVQGFYRHVSEATGTPMRFSVYQPPQARERKVPVLFYLAGLTCTEETFMMKAGAQRYAAQHGLMLVAPDTSPRNTGYPGEADSWDFGTAAGFYLDATREPWSKSFRMYSYVAHELRELIATNFPALPDRLGITGHSMGGHGALVLALKNPDVYRSVSAFAPVTAPSQCPWGIKAFSNYLGDQVEEWHQYDASELMKTRKRPYPHGILIDQGLEDQFLDVQLLPHYFEAACIAADQPLQLRRHAGYDHNYYFISSFIEDHVAWHARLLNEA